MIQITCKGNGASCTRTERLTSGMVGLQCEFIFDEAWDGLAKTAVFLAGNEQRDVLLTGALCTVPWEVLRHSGYQLVIGVYGSNEDGTLIIPTVYAMCGGITSGADPSGDESTDPTLPVWGQLQGMIGNLGNLSTASKDNLVSAINEAAQSGGGGGASVELDTTLTQSGKAADAKAVGDALADKQPKGDYLTRDELPDMTAYRTAEAQDAIDAGKQNTLIQSGAAVGQIAKIAAVDDNGKPTAWQAVDMPRGGGDVWEFGGTIPLDLTTPTAIYEFAPCSIWKKVRIVRVRSSYNADLKSNVWYGASNCKKYDGSIWQQNLLYTNDGYVYHYIEMMSDDDGGIIGTCASSNNANIYIQLQISSYSNNRVASNIPSTYGAKSLTKDSNWMFQAVDPSTAWDGAETYYWWGVRA